MTEPVSDAMIDTYRSLLAVKIAANNPPKPTRGSCGILGKGTPGSRLKNACPAGISLKQWARQLDKQHPRKLDAVAWFASKRGK